MRLRFRFLKSIVNIAVGVVLPIPVWAVNLDAQLFSLFSAVPFVLLLFGIALLPLTFANFWHNHYGKFTLFCAILSILSIWILFGAKLTFASIIHIAITEYIPFILLLLALFVVSGGIFFSFKIRGTPLNNLLLLSIGSILASLMGTTGAAMLLIRPLLRANYGRKYITHTYVFFILIVANIGGSFTPLGDPPLFLGFLKGVSFFWLLNNIWLEVLISLAILLTMYFVIDSYFYDKENHALIDDHQTNDISINKEKKAIVIGKINILFLFLICGLVLLSGAWQSDVAVYIFGNKVTLPTMIRDIGLIIIVLLSLRWTPKKAREGNEFSWDPIVEVAKIFAGIFITIAPVMAMLSIGQQGVFGGLFDVMHDIKGEPIPLMYLWITGLLSGFLDNAPTYLVAFNMAGDSAQILMNQQAKTLAAISIGSVFMGALSYVGNAPNLMVKAVVNSHNIHMPSFFGYLLWSFAILIPLFVLLSVLFFI